MADVEVRKEGAIAILTLNRPKTVNAIGPRQVSGIVAALHESEADGDVGAVVLTGAGPGFCAGGDRVSTRDLLLSGDPTIIQHALTTLHELILALRKSPLPIVAAVHGSAFGAGFSIALACDLIVATRDARFCQVFVKLDVAPDMGSAWLLGRTVGSHRAKELMMLGDEISGEEAHRLGIVNRLADTSEEALATALDLAHRLAAVAPWTRAMSKTLINRSESLTLEDSLVLESHVQTIAITRSSEKFLSAPKSGARTTNEVNG